jgi:hypothetical protein
MEFDVFKEILLTAKRIDALMSGLEKALDIQFGDGILLGIQNDLLKLLVNKCEHESEEVPVIFVYAFDDKWGEKPRIYYLKDRAYYVRSPESLYEYLMDKLKQSDKEALE